ncbi:2-C-methyl-D-erythritol 4-phosphate cytidylyltransferase [Chitinibacter bivalviorum]|uniref:2-C-methyl-D-erythritol 4-phosphate cytidylyltransferase n=1 Tax=Chitinibacter bivalviorum TaxID=2739434 RepID=A0A7H9BI84_9NEIS|nr:2-C-methyl-D-erythritol 4-phosphate cytidylyltransferase [Chitinibacter bivalviorum]QLG88433.1 2-C-methyl-D-erythritol 4-phosphate cytidylyltransferase [Chitinibacter bivalviorum]
MKKIALVPAAGSGSRMASATPKQYLDLLGQPLIAHTLRALLGATEINQVVVVISPEDEWWASYDWSALLGDLSRLLVLRVGGASRAESVMNGLAALDVPDDSWVLVHDAARPCLTSAQVSQMITQLEYDAVGGILAVPVADTLKVAASEYDQHGHAQIERTTPRAGLWQAQTPQMFRRGELLAALQDALPQHVNDITDEASALERLGKTPKLIMGSPWNLKVTYPQDLQLAGLLLKAQP